MLIFELTMLVLDRANGKWKPMTVCTVNYENNYYLCFSR